jgi:hypothetical protein
MMLTGIAAEREGRSAGSRLTMQIPEVAKGNR